MNYIRLTIFLCLYSFLSFSQNDHRLIFPDTLGWNILNENQTLKFDLNTTNPAKARFSIEGADKTGIQFDSTGKFMWTPSYDFTDRVARTREVTVIFEAYWPDQKRHRESITFTVNHVNRSPIVEDLPVFYVKQSTNNAYQIPQEYVYDPDGDPLVFRTVQSQMPEGASLTSQGLISWNLSKGQFASLKNNPTFIEFVVQDQPDKAESKGRLKIAQTQKDLPSDISIVPGDSVFMIKEDETLNLKIYISDPNGDDNVANAGFVSNDKRVPVASLKENTALQYEFTWTPGYDFVDDAQMNLAVDLVFYVLDKSNNRAQRKVRIRVQDAENLIKKDNNLFQKYRINIVEA